MFRRTPSKLAPTDAMAARERALRASVLRSTRATSQLSKACRKSRYLASAFTPVPWAEAASQVYPISTAHRPLPEGQGRGSRKAVAPTTRPSAGSTCAYGTTVPSAARPSCASTYARNPSRPGTHV
ncbi:hypothetical protein STANM309S_01173 [Streptomyces tanashiensis]